MTNEIDICNHLNDFSDYILFDLQLTLS